ncbi:EAL domain-containing protein [Halodurantibacterium flavum]
MMPATIGTMGLLQRFINLSPNPTMVTDGSLRILCMNDAVETVLGLPRSLAGRHDHPQGILSPEVVARLAAIEAEVLATGIPFDGHEYLGAFGPGPWRLCIRRLELTAQEAAEIGLPALIVAEMIDISEISESAERERRGRALMASIFESSADAIRLLDLDGNLVLSNAAADRIFDGRPIRNLDGWRDVVPPEKVQEIGDAFARVARGETARIIIGDPPVQFGWGPPRNMDIVMAPVRGPDGKPERILSIWRDVTELRQARLAAEDAALRMTAVLENTMDGVLVVDRDFNVTYLNGPAQRALRDAQPMLGRNLWSVIPGNEERFAHRCREVMATRRAVAFEDQDAASNRWFQVQVAPLGDGLSVFFRDVTKTRLLEENRRNSEKALYRLARLDGLTGLPNRRQFHEALTEALVRARREPDGRAAVLMVDLDNFKPVNDSYGHPVGDRLLQILSGRLRAAVRAGETVARVGGDEFMIVLPRLGSVTEASDLAERIIATLSEPCMIEGIELVVGASIGIALSGSDGETADQLIKAADIALYAAKEGGRGIWRRFEQGMDDRLRERHEIKMGLRRAFRAGELEVHYQPLQDIGTGRVTSCEALVRWPHPTRGMIPPSDFMPVAEESGLIARIGEWVLRTACAEAAGWPDDIALAVNLSVVQFRGGRLPAMVRAALADSGLDPGRLQLEITESVLLDATGHNLETLAALRALGVKIVMDDFGTGYSSLSYLRSFPFDKIKVDRSFIQDLPREEALAIIRAVAIIGRSLSIPTTVEGVETEEQLRMVEQEGFTEAQGFIFSRPMTAQALRDALGVKAGVTAADGGLPGVRTQADAIR